VIGTHNPGVVRIKSPPRVPSFLLLPQWSTQE
jgi:hypothetical protein